MKKTLKAAALAMAFALAFAAIAQAAVVPVKSPNWEPNTKKAINDMFAMYGKDSKGYDATCKPYATFDFDNSTSILDVEEQLAIYQLEKLRFAMRPDQVVDVICEGIPDVNKDLGEDYNHATVLKLAQDCQKAYTKLFMKGYVAADNSLEAKQAEWMETADWKEFATKMRFLYDAIGDNFDVSVSYPWITYWFTGMTPAQIQKLATESHVYYTQKSRADAKFWQKVTWESPKGYKSKAGQVKIKFNQGINVSPELAELYQCLKANGFDVWICSASYIDVILPAATLDIFGLKGAVTGVVAMTNIYKDGVMTHKYDYDFHAQTQGIGKSQTIEKIIAPRYKGHGPILVCCDSQGDFNFCSEWKDTKVVVCLNRQRKDDAGLFAAAAIWQNENNIDLAKAVAMGDARFCLQGRNENGGYLWPETACHLLAKGKGVLHKKAEGWLDQLRAGTSIKDLINNNSKLKGKPDQFVGYKVR